MQRGKKLYHAAAGRGEDASPIGDSERARIRKQALDWLLAELTSHANRIKSGKPEDRTAVQGALREWQDDPDLACVSDPAALASLPPEDRKAFGHLWADVADLLRRK